MFTLMIRLQFTVNNRKNRFKNKVRMALNIVHRYREEIFIRDTIQREVLVAP